VWLQPRTAPCRSETAWHSESALLLCSFEYGADPSRAPGTAVTRIDAALGISSTPRRVLLGDVKLTWRDESRLHSIELRTGSGQWELSSLRIPGETAEKSSMTFELACDVNRISGVDVDVRVLWDATTACIALRFGDAEPQGGRWVAIADKVFACVGSQQTLIALRFAECEDRDGGHRHDVRAGTSLFSACCC
jgi:hypothetical protein